MNRSVCWNITSRCNENCKFCFRLQRQNDLLFEENLKILYYLKESGIDKITWTGGEALLYTDIIKLLKESKKIGIKNKLITNGASLSTRLIDEIKDVVDTITLPIEGTNNDIHKKMGRGTYHYDNIIHILDYIKDNNINIGIKINTVVSKMNYEELDNIAKLLAGYKISKWKLFRFRPLRYEGKKNCDLFYLDNNTFNNVVDDIIDKQEFCVEKRNWESIDNKYLLISANGDFIITKNGEDEIIFNYQQFDKEKITNALEVSYD